MKNGKHSPGPWDCKQYADGTVYIGMPRSHNTDHDHPLANLIAEICGDITLSITRANARLIVAAPDLLEALKNLENDDKSIPNHAWEMVKAAIAKAEGDLNAN